MTLSAAKPRKPIVVSVAVLDAFDRRSANGTPLPAHVRRALRADLERHAYYRRLLPVEEATAIAEEEMAEMERYLRRRERWRAGCDQ
jgi:hypothetical protein